MDQEACIGGFKKKWEAFNNQKAIADQQPRVAVGSWLWANHM
jgi:hypothetical protein